MKDRAYFRCLVMALVSGFFVALNVIAYLIEIGKMQPIGAMPSIAYFDAITQITRLFTKESLSEVFNLFKQDWFNAIKYFSPIILFLLSSLTFLHDFAKLVHGDYVRISNIINKSLICAATLFMWCFGLIEAFKSEIKPDSAFVVDYFKNLYSNDAFVFTAVMVSLFGVVLAIVFALVPQRRYYRR